MTEIGFYHLTRSTLAEALRGCWLARWRPANVLW